MLFHRLPGGLVDLDQGSEELLDWLLDRPNGEHGCCFVCFLPHGYLDVAPADHCSGQVSCFVCPNQISVRGSTGEVVEPTLEARSSAILEQ